MSKHLWKILIVLFFILFGLLKYKARSRQVPEVFEADLNPANLGDFSRTGNGEVEIRFDSEGNADLLLHVIHTRLPEGATVSLLIKGLKTGDFQISKGRVYEKFKTLPGMTIPSVKAGDTVEVVYNGITILSGTFYLA